MTDNKNHPGKLIVLEGISGTGKETQARELSENLNGRGIKNIIVFHPTPATKTLLSDWRGERNIDHITETYLLLADRYDTVSRIIKPALDSGTWVIGLRNFVSALVYQARTPAEVKWTENEFRRFEPSPDLLFYFDITSAQAQVRINSRHQQTGEPLGKFETPELLEQKRQIYIKRLENFPHMRIDASDTIENIQSAIISSVNTFL